jgi:hypothetical protein
MNSRHFGDSKYSLPRLQQQNIRPCPELHESSQTFIPSLPTSVVLKDLRLSLAFRMIPDFVM